MPKINNKEIYPIDQNVTPNDYVIGTDGDDHKKTKNFKLSDIAEYVKKVTTETMSVGVVSIGFKYHNQHLSNGYFVSEVDEVKDVVTLKISKESASKQNLIPFFDLIIRNQQYYFLNITIADNPNINSFYEILFAKELKDTNQNITGYEFKVKVKYDLFIAHNLIENQIYNINFLLDFKKISENTPANYFLEKHNNILRFIKNNEVISEIDFAEYIDDYTLSQVGNEVQFFKENNVVSKVKFDYKLVPISGTNKIKLTLNDKDISEIDLTPYLDDTNLSRLVEGKVVENTYNIEMKRDDGSSFVLDLSKLFETLNKPPFFDREAKFIVGREITDAMLRSKGKRWQGWWVADGKSTYKDIDGTIKSKPSTDDMRGRYVAGGDGEHFPYEDESDNTSRGVKFGYFRPAIKVNNIEQGNVDFDNSDEFVCGFTDEGKYSYNNNYKGKGKHPDWTAYRVFEKDPAGASNNDWSFDCEKDGGIDDEFAWMLMTKPKAKIGQLIPEGIEHPVPSISGTWIQYVEKVPH